MGGADCICSDKTGIPSYHSLKNIHTISYRFEGTLTKNEMTLTDWWNDELASFEREGKFDLIKDQQMSESFANLFKEQIALNSAALLYPS